MSTKRTTILLGEVKESFHMAMSALTAHKLRSALTLLGVLVGVFSIIVVMTAMRVMQSDVEREMSQLGGQTFMIQKWPAVYFGGPEGFEKFWRRKNITYAHGMQVEEKATLARSVGMETTFWGGQIETRYKKSAPNVQLFGETPGSFPARNWELQEGRLLLDVDVDSTRDVCVLGNGLAKTVFPRASAVGEWLKINGINYLVVGVLEPKGGQLNGDQDNFAVVPITTGMNRFGRWRRSLSILVQARSQAMYDDTVEQVRGVLRVARKVPPGKEDDFELFSNDSAGIGIMNIMLVSVTERTREIGIRRAIGAKKRNIMTQFIMEAIVICEVGGVMGVLFGILGGNSTAYFLKLTPVIPVDWAVIGLVICSIVGIIFGTYPAYKAANLDPIESLRYE